MPLRRAKQACVHCHRRRIRCDVLQQHPCSNCVAQEVACELGVSRRGKYPRKKAKSQQIAPAPAAPAPAPGPGRPSPQEPDMSPDTNPNPIQPHHDRHKITDPTVFLGESSPLTTVMDPRHPRLHYPLPPRLLPASTRDEAVRLHQVQQAAHLESNGALSFPPEATVNALLKAYFTWFHPCFPIVDRVAICRAKAHTGLNGIPPLLLQAMLFIGVSLCDDETFARTEFPVRYRAKFLFYSRARAIYDADAEANPIVKLQALFMLSSWRGGPGEERDVRFWLSIAVSLAQKRGMHMMSKFAHPPKERRLCKRIWWALYTRDQQSAAALGLPPRIRDEDGDVAMLEPDDVLEDESVDDDVFGHQRPQDLVYPVEMAKLARLLRTVVSTQYLHHQKPDLATRNTLSEQLCQWESELPVELRWGSVFIDPVSLFLKGLLHMTYQNLYILLYRRVFLNPTPHDDGHIALDAATKSTRIMEDLLSAHLIQHAPTHLITHSFTTLCIHTIHHRRSSGTTRTLAEHRARLCLLSLEELQKSWDLENWVLHLFFKGLDDRTAEVLGLTQGEHVGTGVGVGGGVGAGAAVGIQAQDGIVTGHSTTPGLGDDGADLTAGSSAGGETLMPPVPQPDDWYGWVPWEDEADALNLQNLEFLYRFL